VSLAPSCPTPSKRSYLRKRDANLAIRRWRHGDRKLIEAYRCSCDRWHLGNRAFKRGSEFKHPRGREWPKLVQG
jgi:hypothetical protein